MKSKLKKQSRKSRKMKTRLQGILNKKNFFSVIHSTDDSAKYTLEKASQILIKNIHSNWLRYLQAKTLKSMPVFIQNSLNDIEHNKKAKPPFGIIQNNNDEYKNAIMEHNLNKYAPEKTTTLNFSVILPTEDLMQYFIQWQRYRKYWWSSITTSPSLFSIDDIQHTDVEANVDIVARLPTGPQPVEHISMKTKHDEFENNSCLSCSMSLEGALLILLLDASNNSSDDYLRLHRKLAPYKISFALYFQESNNEVTLKELATLLYNRLKLEKISAFLPDFSMDVETQIRQNLQMGVTYTAILSEGTLKTGIFYLLNSSTMLKEQIHVADFHKYAAIICSAK